MIKVYRKTTIYSWPRYITAWPFLISSNFIIHNIYGILHNTFSSLTNCLINSFFFCPFLRLWIVNTIISDKKYKVPPPGGSLLKDWNSSGYLKTGNRFFVYMLVLDVWFKSRCKQVVSCFNTILDIFSDIWRCWRGKAVWRFAEVRHMDCWIPSKTNGRFIQDWWTNQNKGLKLLIKT